MGNSPAIPRPPWWPIVLAAVAPTLATVLYLHAADSTEIVQILYFVSKALLFSFPAAWWLIIERRARAVSFSSRGLTDGENVAQFEHPRELKLTARRKMSPPLRWVGPRLISRGSSLRSSSM